MGIHEYEVVGRKRPTDNEPNPQLFRMRIFTHTPVHAKSQFWYFMRRVRKMKKTTGEILSVSEVFEKSPDTIKNFGIWLRYDSRSNTVNCYKEFRDLSRVNAVAQLYMDMAGRHRTRERSIQIMDVKEVAAKDTRRAATQQFHDSSIKFPLTHRRLRVPMKKYKSRFRARRVGTVF